MNISAIPKIYVYLLIVKYDKNFFKSKDKFRFDIIDVKIFIFEKLDLQHLSDFTKKNDKKYSYKKILEQNKFPTKKFMIKDSLARNYEKEESLTKLTLGENLFKTNEI